MINHDYWKDFIPGNWQKNINVKDFISKNFVPYNGDESFLKDSSAKTKNLWSKCKQLLRDEYNKGGVLDVDTKIVSGITSHMPGYIDKKLEVIHGLQTDKPLKRGVLPFGGIRTLKSSCDAYDYKLSEHIEDFFSKYRKTHNDGVFSAYSTEMKKARKSGVITGLPDAYGRGRIIGDYRRVALYGVDFLIEQKINDLLSAEDSSMTDEIIRLREEISEQINALKQLIQMADSYGFDIRYPAKNSVEAIQWTYFAFLASIKETNGAANSLGRVNTFLTFI